MVELTASAGADQAEARLREALDAHGLQLFARIDHAAGARKADVELEADVVLIVGNARVGTPPMQADPRVGIELPLRMLIWPDSDGTHVAYRDPHELADRHALEGHEQTLERHAAVLAKPAGLRQELGPKGSSTNSVPSGPALTPDFGVSRPRRTSSRNAFVW
jgi:uncharacterized protein (DUF302 family)